MIHFNDHHTDRIIDPWFYLSPKRRKLLEKSWAGLFRKELLKKIPVSECLENTVF